MRPRFHAPRRHHVADDVFEQLAAAILRGELPPGSRLPPERELAVRFRVSPITIRQAVHHLAELNLVRVRQGGATTVLDPEAASNLGLLDLFYRLAPRGVPGTPDLTDMIEKQYLQGLSMVSVAARRAPKKELRALARLVDAVPDDEQVEAFEERFWRALAAAGGNRIFIIEVGWWYERLADRPMPVEISSAPRSTRLAFYRELTRRLVAGDAPVEYYVAAVSPVLDALVKRTRRQ